MEWRREDHPQLIIHNSSAPTASHPDSPIEAAEYVGAYSCCIYVGQGFNPQSRDEARKVDKLVKRWSRAHISQSGQKMGHSAG
jgi:hypothetical protein